MVEANLPLEQVLDLVGILAFALSGALLAVRKQFDIVGMVVLAGTTALGGGIIRDLLIGAVPPVAFTNTTWLLLPLAAAVLTFFFHPHVARLRIAVLVCDAAGLGLFCVSGTAKALAYGLGPAPALLLGVVTAIGGGILRDLLAGDVPTVLRRDSKLYAIPSFIGAAVVVLTWHTSTYGLLAAVTGAGVAFGLRLLALWRGWRAPTPIA